LGRKVGVKAMIWGAIISSSPDFDVLVTPMLDPVSALFAHRGFSHSLLLASMAAPLLGWLLAKLHRDRTVSILEWAMLAFLSLLGHIAIDCFNTYGTGILEPFRHARVAYDSMSITDLALLVPLTAIAILLYMFNTKVKTRQILGWVAVAFTAIYVLFSVLVKVSVESRGKTELASQGIIYNRMLTTPLPLSNLLWKVVAEQDTAYQVGYYSLFDSARIKFESLPRNEAVLNNLLSYPEVTNILRFTKGFHSASVEDGQVWIYDLRYGSLGFNDPKPYVFSIGVRELHGKIDVTRAHPDRKINWRNFISYIRRIKRDLN